jgi:hypothetical protein
VPPAAVVAEGSEAAVPQAAVVTEGSEAVVPPAAVVAQGGGAGVQSTVAATDAAGTAPATGLRAQLGSLKSKVSNYFFDGDGSTAAERDPLELGGAKIPEADQGDLAVKMRLRPNAVQRQWLGDWKDKLVGRFTGSGGDVADTAAVEGGEPVAAATGAPVATGPVDSLKAQVGALRDKAANSGWLGGWKDKIMGRFGPNAEVATADGAQAAAPVAAGTAPVKGNWKELWGLSVPAADKGDPYAYMRLNSVQKQFWSNAWTGVKSRFGGATAAAEVTAPAASVNAPVAATVAEAAPVAATVAEAAPVAATVAEAAPVAATVAEGAPVASSEVEAAVADAAPAASRTAETAVASEVNPAAAAEVADVPPAAAGANPGLGVHSNTALAGRQLSPDALAALKESQEHFNTASPVTNPDLWRAAGGIPTGDDLVAYNAGAQAKLADFGGYNDLAGAAQNVEFATAKGAALGDINSTARNYLQLSQNWTNASAADVQASQAAWKSLTDPAALQAAGIGARDMDQVSQTALQQTLSDLGRQPNYPGIERDWATDPALQTGFSRNKARFLSMMISDRMNALGQIADSSQKYIAARQVALNG